MKLYGKDWSQSRERKRAGVKLPPLRTLREMADEFGISYQSLIATMKHFPGAPESTMKVRNNATGENTWYEPVAMRRWWKSVQDARSQKNNTPS